MKAQRIGMLATLHARAWIPSADIFCFAATSFVVDVPEKCIASSPSNDVLLSAYPVSLAVMVITKCPMH
jgi:hypothetical protein